MKHRLLRVRELLKREISDVLQRDFSFRDALVTVNDVDITPDLRQAHVFLGIIAGKSASEEAILHQINERHAHIQRRVSSRVILKYTPQMHFKADRSVERGVRVVSLIDELVPDEGGEGHADGHDDESDRS